MFMSCSPRCARGSSASFAPSTASEEQNSVAIRPMPRGLLMLAEPEPARVGSGARFVARYLQIEGADLAQALKLVLLGSGEDRTPRGVREMRSTALDDVQMAVVNELKIVAILVELRDVPVVASYPLR